MTALTPQNSSDYSSDPFWGALPGIVQSKDNTSVLDALPRGFGKARVRMGTYKNNEYIQALNRALQQELAAISTYHRIPKGEAKDPKFNEMQEEHREAGNKLVTLVIAHQGIPVERSDWTSGLQSAIVSLAGTLPDSLSHMAVFGTCKRIENHLVESYRELLEFAPSGDRCHISTLLYTTRARMKYLEQKEAKAPNK